jgi:hypothetical protein
MRHIAAGALASVSLVGLLLLPSAVMAASCTFVIASAPPGVPPRTLIGTGFAPAAPISITQKREANGSLETTHSTATSDRSGNFSYVVDDRVGQYVVEATDGSCTAQAEFTVLTHGGGIATATPPATDAVAPLRSTHESLVLAYGILVACAGLVALAWIRMRAHRSR